MTEPDKSRRERAERFMQAERGAYERGQVDSYLAFAESEANLARRAALEEAAEAVVAACGPCDGRGYTVTSRADHAWCGGNDRLCQSLCPVEVEMQEGCEYCGRPASTIRALIPEEAR